MFFKAWPKRIFPKFSFVGAGGQFFISKDKIFYVFKSAFKPKKRVFCLVVVKFQLKKGKIDSFFAMFVPLG